MIKFLKIFKVVCFLLIGILLFQQINEVFFEKSTYGRYLNYKNMENVDILILGSSHSKNGIGAIDLEEKVSKSIGKEVDVYNYSIYGMRIEQMYYVFKELLKYQKPEVLVVETFSFVETAPEDREILARRAFDYFPLSINKIEAIKYCTNGDYQTYLLPIMKYHTRWKEITLKDIGYKYNEELWKNEGRVYSTSKVKMEVIDDYFMQDFSKVDEEMQLGARIEEKLEGLLELAKENDIKVLFLSIPFKEQLGVTNIDNIHMNNYVNNKYVDDDFVQMFDLNKEINEIKFDYKYLHNEGHCNKAGAKKVTSILAEYISESYADILEEGK